jgi:chromosome segregation protein
MFLKSLTLKGFKSFAEATTLSFEPGITVVVGPNGSGKSNVIDAVAWVLGAQGPRTLRSAKMEDVIFAGTASKPALGRAEVSLTIDNSSGILAIGFAEVTITRTLFRSGDSEYAINGVPCRLLDIQELLSDSGVGRQQHVIVSQGQLDGILNARPEDRRLVIEEAAGVLKYRRRREKAQRRLEATEGNLLRLQDLLREVRRQLRPLERQADAARRHGALVEELTAIRLHLAGREVASLRTRSAAGAATRAEVGQAREGLTAALAGLDADVVGSEADLSARGADDLADDLVRFETMRERARGLAAVLVERQRSIARDRDAFIDQALVASLEDDAAKLRDALTAVDDAAAELVPETDELVADERALAAERDDVAARWGDAPSGAAHAAAEARGELAALRAALLRGTVELERAERRLGVVRAKAARLVAELDGSRDDLADAAEREEPLAAGVAAAGAEHAAASTAVAEAEEARRAAEAEWHAWSARAEALSLALDEARARAGAERLGELDGIVGTLLELVEVDEGWEAAFEAAAGEAIAAVVVDDVGAARTALAHLRDTGAAGAVLALGSLPRRLPDGARPAIDGGAEPVRAHVRSTGAEVAGLLDVLLGAAVAVRGPWEAALDVALAHPDTVVVTLSGDRFAPSGWRIGAAGAGATGAARDEARQRADETIVVVERIRADLDVARARADEARAADAAASRATDGNVNRRQHLETAVARLEREAGELAAEEEAVRAHLDELAARVAFERDRASELEAALPALEAGEAAEATQAAEARAARDRLERRGAEVHTLRTRLEVRAAGLDERRRVLSARLADVESRLERNRDQREEAEHGRRRLEGLAAVTARLAEVVGARLEHIESGLRALRERRRQQSEEVRAIAAHLDDARRRRVDAERELAELRERIQRAELDDAEVRMRLEAAVEAVRRDFDCEPDVAIAAGCPELPPGTSPPARVRELERELRLMGPVNPLALEEHSALLERHEFLEAQLDDVKSTRRELSKVIRAIDTEIVEVFAAAYADVADNFATLFQTLFPGGTGRLRLTDADNLLETGIELEARPSGKNIRQLSLLSGGERSLTALAFLFAVFRSRPSPFYLMDEVEAALDDVNLHRFLDLIGDFRREAQLVIVSHQKRTMEAADCLYGVTMQTGGSSKVVSERVAP